MSNEVLILIIVVLAIVYVASPQIFNQSLTSLNDFILKTFNINLFGNLLNNSTCTPDCNGKCGGVSDGCSGTCSASCSCTPNWNCGSWSSCSNSLQTKTCSDSAGCGTANPNPTSQSCSSVTYGNLDSYLSVNPSVNYWVTQMNPNTKQYFLTYLNNLQTSGTTNIVKPNIDAIASAINQHKSYNSALSSSEQNIVDQLFAAKVAHSIWLDMGNKVSWKLNFYNQQELGNLLSEESYMTHQWESLYLDWNPDLDYQYASQFISNSRIDSIGNMVKSLENFRHVAQGDSPASENTIQGALNDKVAQGGCHGMSAVISALSDSLNIVTEDSNLGWLGAGHAGVVFPEIGVLVHGDDIYTTILRGAPGIAKIAPWSYFKQYIEPAGRGGMSSDGHGEINYYSMRYVCLQALAYPHSAMKTLCCGGNSKDTCINQFELNYNYMIPMGSPNSCLTSNEINQLYTKMTAMC